MTITKTPFVNYTLDEDKGNPLDAGKIFTIRLNAEEYQQLREDMKDFNLKNESTTLKLLAQIGRNVIHNTFTRQNIRWLFSPSRVKQEEA